MQGDEDQWAANTRRFTQLTGVTVRVDAENFEDIRPKAAVAANIGSGPDIVLGWYDDPHQYADKLHDLTELATYLDAKYGGWYDVCKRYCMHEGRWIAIGCGFLGGCLVYRPSLLRAAGYEKPPATTDGFLKLIFSPDDQKVLGVSIVGEHACELIHLAAAVMSFGGTIDYFIQSVFNYPALSDVYKYAAYDGLQALARRRAQMPGLPQQRPVTA